MSLINKYLPGGKHPALDIYIRKMDNKQYLVERVIKNKGSVFLNPKSEWSENIVLFATETEAFQKMLLCPESLAIDAFYNKGIFKPVDLQSHELVTGWTHPSTPIFKGLLLETLEDELDLFYSEWLETLGWENRVFLIHDFEDTDFNTDHDHVFHGDIPLKEGEVLTDIFESEIGVHGSAISPIKSLIADAEIEQAMYDFAVQDGSRAIEVFAGMLTHLNEAFIKQSPDYTPGMENIEITMNVPGGRDITIHKKS